MKLRAWHVFLPVLLGASSCLGIGPGLTPDASLPESVAVSASPAASATSGGSPAAGVSEDFAAASFQDPTRIDNAWLPLRPGTQYVYKGATVEDQVTIPHRLEFTVTDLTKEIAGVQTVVVWIADYSAGELVEKEIAFYAQDDVGRVWYLGEFPEDYAHGAFLEAPAWIHGLQDAVAGIKMRADPQPGSRAYSQGWGPAVEFTDRAREREFLTGDCVPASCYRHVLVIEEFNPEEPGSFQLKYYARGVGNTRVGWDGVDAQQEELALIKLVELDTDALARIRALALELEAHAYEISPDLYRLTEPMELPGDDSAR